MSTNMVRMISAKKRHWRHAGTNPDRSYCSETRRRAAASPPTGELGAAALDRAASEARAAAADQPTWQLQRREYTRLALYLADRCEHKGLATRTKVDGTGNC